MPLLTAAMALGLGWLVLRTRRPDPVVGSVLAELGRWIGLRRTGSVDRPADPSPAT